MLQDASCSRGVHFVFEQIICCQDVAFSQSVTGIAEDPNMVHVGMSMSTSNYKLRLQSVVPHLLSASQRVNLGHVP